jgi:hypothetical protein
MASRKRPSAAEHLAELEEPAPTASERKRKITLYFREALLEEARSVVLALGAEGLEPSNLSQLFGAALEAELKRLRKAHNAGEPFPPYKARLPGGRPRRG